MTKYKMKYKPRQYAYYQGGRNGFDLDTRGYNERHAIEYAEWIAKRDGIRLPPDRRYVIYAGIEVNGKLQTRIRSVASGLVNIEIPRWDFVPSIAEYVQPAIAA